MQSRENNFSQKVSKKDPIDICEQIVLFAKYLTEHCSRSTNGDLGINTWGLYPNDPIAYAKDRITSHKQKVKPPGPTTDYNHQASVVFVGHGKYKSATKHYAVATIKEINDKLAKLGITDRISITNFEQFPPEALPEQIPKDELPYILEAKKKMEDRILLVNIAPLLKHPQIFAKLNHLLHTEKDQQENTIESRNQNEMRQFNRREWLITALRRGGKTLVATGALGAVADGARRATTPPPKPTKGPENNHVFLGTMEALAGAAGGYFAHAGLDFALENENPPQMSTRHLWRIDEDRWDELRANLKKQLPPFEQSQGHTIS